MKTIVKSVAVIFSLIIVGCGGKEEKKKDGFIVDRQKTKKAAETAPEVDEAPASKRITLDEKGVGQIKDITLDPVIDQEMATAGAELFKTNCTAYQKLDKRFIGPSPVGIMERRAPE